jgi:formylmethanofuran dehydrogenase subunit B
MECDGTFYRLDDVPIYFEPFLDSPFKFTQSNEDTLKQLFTRIKEKRRQTDSLPSAYQRDEELMSLNLPGVL